MERRIAARARQEAQLDGHRAQQVVCEKKKKKNKKKKKGDFFTKKKRSRDKKIECIAQELKPRTLDYSLSVYSLTYVSLGTGLIALTLSLSLSLSLSLEQNSLVVCYTHANNSSQSLHFGFLAASEMATLTCFSRYSIPRARMAMP